MYTYFIVVYMMMYDTETRVKQFVFPQLLCIIHISKFWIILMS